MAAVLPLNRMVHIGALLVLFIPSPPFVLSVFTAADNERADLSSALSALTDVTILFLAVLAAAF